MIIPDKTQIQYDDEIFLVLVRQDWMDDYECWRKTVEEIKKILRKWEPPKEEEPKKEVIDTGKSRDSFAESLTKDLKEIKEPYNQLVEIVNQKTYTVAEKVNEYSLRYEDTYNVYKDINKVQVGDIHHGETIVGVNDNKAYAGLAGYWYIDSIIQERRCDAWRNGHKREQEFEPEISYTDNHRYTITLVKNKSGKYVVTVHDRFIAKMTPIENYAFLDLENARRIAEILKDKYDLIG